MIPSTLEHNPDLAKPLSAYNRKKEGAKKIIHFAVAANEYANVVGERFLADDK